MERKQLQRIKYPLLSCTEGRDTISCEYSKDNGNYIKYSNLCHSRFFGYSKEDILTLTLHHNITEKYTPNDINTWCSFLTDAGFPCRYINKDNINRIEILGKDYISKSHFLSGLTALRFINYHRYGGYDKICNTCLNLWNNTNLTAYECLILAHMILASTPYYNYGHALVRSDSTKVIPYDEVLKKYTKSLTVNDCHSHYELGHEEIFSKAVPFYTSGNYKKFIKYIKEKKII